MKIWFYKKIENEISKILLRAFGNKKMEGKYY